MKNSYHIDIDQTIIENLNRRLSMARWMNPIENTDWQYGTNADYLRELCEYWQTEFNWKKQQSWLNSFYHFTAPVDGNEIHFIHAKGKGIHAMPLLLVHGFPDSFIRYLKLIPLLTTPDEDGFCFDLVIPSMPGYGFSYIPTQPGMNPQLIAKIFTQLMVEELGYLKFFAHGGDWGSSIIEQIAINHPASLMGIHLTDIPFRHLLAPPEGLSEEEKKFMEKAKQWTEQETAYAMIQATKPETVATALNNSPVSLASWIIEKFHRWSDCDGDIETCFTKDELLTNLTIYWATQTIGSAVRLYYETAQVMQQEGQNKQFKKPEVPAAIAAFPKDSPPPREFAERIFNVKQWTLMPRGGHFAAMEQPQLLSGDIRKFFRMVAEEKGIIRNTQKKAVLH